LHPTEGPSLKDAKLDYGLKSTFLERLNEAEKLHIFDLTTRTSRELHRWSAKYPLIRRVRVWPLSLSVAAATPFASVPVLVTMARMNLWVFTIDDLFDEEIVPFAELRRRVDRYHDILSGERANPKQDRDTLVRALQDIRDDLQTYDLFEPLVEEWAHAVSSTLKAMMQEYEWRSSDRAGNHGANLPSYDAYCQHGLYSIGGPPHIWTTLIAVGDTSMLLDMDRIKELERTASLCIRLANDLQSHPREMTEGKINSIVILQREAMEQGQNAEQALVMAQNRVRQDIQRLLTHCDYLQGKTSTTTGFPERAIADIARFVCDFYVNHDYHTFTVGTARPQ
jgi:hypothetical protein